jgi:hypothetical protein
MKQSSTMLTNTTIKVANMPRTMLTMFLMNGGSFEAMTQKY